MKFNMTEIEFRILYCKTSDYKTLWEGMQDFVHHEQPANHEALIYDALWSASNINPFGDVQNADGRTVHSLVHGGGMSMKPSKAAMTITLTREEAQQVMNDLHGANLCAINSMSGRHEMRRLIDKAIETIRAKLAQHEPEQVDAPFILSFMGAV